MAFCKSCGAPVTGQFCARCGASAGAATPQTGESAPPGSVPASGGGLTDVTPGATVAARRTSPVVWVLVGCGALIVIAAIFAMSTGWFVAHKLSQAGVQIRTKGNGDKGSLEIRSKDGSVRFGGGRAAKLPMWLPEYPGAKAEGTFAAQSDKGDAGSFHFVTKDSIEQVLDYYDAAMKKAGFTTDRNTYTAGGSENAGTVTANDSDHNRGAVITATSGSDGTSVNVVYHRKR